MQNCNTLNDISDKICVQNKTEDINLNVFNLITNANEWKKIIKHISCKCKYKLKAKNTDQIKSGIMININMSPKIQENIYAKKVIFGIPLNVLVKMASI